MYYLETLPWETVDDAVAAPCAVVIYPFPEYEYGTAHMGQTAE